MTDGLREAFEIEWRTAAQARATRDYARAYAHLERAHVLGQRRTWLHLRSHIGFLKLGWLQRDGGEVAGQLSRLVAALLFSRVWVPEGNTGGANVDALRTMPIPADLQAILDGASRGRTRSQ